MDVSIIIVNYNTKELTKNCLASIFKQTQNINFEVIVSDNNSTDGSIEMIRKDFPQVILVDNKENLGFGRANNRGLKVAKGKYVFYLNSDTILLNNAVKLFFDYFEMNGEKLNIGALGCNLQDSNGNIIHSFGKIKSLRKKTGELLHCFLGINKDTLKYFFTRKLGTFSINHKAKFTIGEVPYITGADLFVKNDEFAYYDERYFMYNEEVDLQLKLHKNELKSLLISGPEIIHLEGGSTKKIAKKVIYLSSSGNIQLYKSYIQFYKKNFYSFFGILTLKIIITLIWINPLIFAKTKKYIKEIWKL